MSVHKNVKRQCKKLSRSWQVISNLVQLSDSYACNSFWHGPHLTKSVWRNEHIGQEAADSCNTWRSRSMSKNNICIVCVYIYIRHCIMMYAWSIQLSIYIEPLFTSQKMLVKHQFMVLLNFAFMTCRRFLWLWLSQSRREPAVQHVRSITETLSSTNFFENPLGLGKQQASQWACKPVI